jgi:hypothetical protein
MSKPLFTTFPSSDTFSQQIYGEFAANFPAVLEAVSNRLRRAVDTNRHSIDFRVEDSLCESPAGESDEALPHVKSMPCFASASGVTKPEGLECLA